MPNQVLKDREIVRKLDEIIKSHAKRKQKIQELEIMARILKNKIQN
jgi:hypothetical protein